MARQGKLEAVRGHESELRRVTAALSDDANRNPVLIGESNNIDKMGVALRLAQKINAVDVPESLRGKRVYSLNLDRLSTGAKDPAEFASRLQAILDETAGAKGRVILFIDELHQLIGTYANQQASEALRDALRQGQLRLIGAATPDAYSKYIDSDVTLGKLFQPIRVGDETASERGGEEFEGDKVSVDLRRMIASAKSGKDRLPLILQVDDVQSKELSKLLTRHDVLVNDRMTEMSSLKVEVPASAIEELAASGLTNYLSPDRKIELLGHVTATTGADLVRSQSGGSILGLISTSSTLDGTGIGIAIIDSGVDAAHRAFSSRIKFKKDFTIENKADKDPYGHGTHVAASAAGISTTNGNSYSGVAPNANIISLRVLNAQGIGKTSDLLSALNWILTPADPNKPVSSGNPLNKDKYGIRVVNLSLGAPAIDSYKNDPVCRAARRLVDAGIVVVAAAGNNGKDASGQKLYGQIHSPGNEPSVITVGATNTFGTDARDDDGITTYSSRGPTRSYWTEDNGIKHYDNLVKPEIAAPGNKLIYAEADDGGSNPNLIARQNPELDSGITDDDNKKLMYLSGTSMATPIVSGAAALLLQINPSLTPNMVKALLMYTAQQLAGFNMLEQGAGQLNVEGAVRVAKLVRTDHSSSTPVGAPFLTTNAVPNPQTTIANQTFTWSQGLILNYTYVTGSNLITKYQRIYDLGMVMGDGLVVGASSLSINGTTMSSGMVMGDNIMTSDGMVMGDGTIFCPTGIMLGDGMMLNDGIMLGDGMVMGDGIMLGDGMVMGDAAVQAMSAMLRGDNTRHMR
jgi:subtilisin family serine protease